MIQINNLIKSYNTKPVLKDISFEISTGQIVGLLGPNGAGKTTILRVITGFIPFESGQVKVSDKNLADPAEALLAKQKIGYLPEENPLYPDLLVFEYLHFMAELKKIDKEKIKEAVDKVVTQAGINEVYYRPIKELSKGFKQRVGLAAAILGDPEILILDEPTEGLDPNQRVDIRNLITHLGKDKTVIISSHVLSEIENMCDHLLIIANGKLVVDGSKQDVLAKVAGKNILKLEIEGENAGQVLSAKNFGIIKIEKQDGHRFSISIETDKDVEIRPQLSQIIRENNWIVWQMYQEQAKLEDVFRDLTK